MISSTIQYLYRLAIAGGIAAFALFGAAACEEEPPAGSNGTNGEEDPDTINGEDPDGNGGDTY